MQRSTGTLRRNLVDQVGVDLRILDVRREVVEAAIRLRLNGRSPWESAPWHPGAWVELTYVGQVVVHPSDENLLRSQPTEVLQRLALVQQSEQARHVHQVDLAEEPDLKQSHSQ